MKPGFFESFDQKRMRVGDRFLGAMVRLRITMYTYILIYLPAQCKLNNHLYLDIPIFSIYPHTHPPTWKLTPRNLFMIKQHHLQPALLRR